MHRARLSASALLAMASCASACVSHSYSARVVSNTVVPASVGPVATGPLVARGRVSVEGSYSHALIMPVDEEVREGAGAAVRSLVRGRIAVGVARDLELGLAIEYGNTAWRDDLATGVGPARPPDMDFHQGSMQLRMKVRRQPRHGLHALVELGLRHTTYSANLSGASSSSGGLFNRPQTTSGLSLSSSDTSMQVAGLVGGYWVFEPLEHLQLAVGGAVGFEPRPRFDETESGDGVASEEMLPPFAAHPVVVGFSFASYTLGPVCFILQVAGGYSRVAPLGGTFVVRLAP